MPPAVGPGGSLRLRDAGQLEWSLVPDATDYAVHRGTIPRVGGLASRMPALDHVCLLRTPASDWLEPETPPEAAFYSLMGAENPCGPALDGLGMTSLGAARPEPSCP